MFDKLFRKSIFNSAEFLILQNRMCNKGLKTHPADFYDFIGQFNQFSKLFPDFETSNIVSKRLIILSLLKHWNF